MPIQKCSNGKYRIGTGSCIYDTQEKAEKVWSAIKLGLLPKTALDIEPNPCWEGYEPIGLKPDGAPNCVPVSQELAETYNDYPESASNNAKRALKWADENGWGGCGTAVGKARANQLAKRENISRDTIARMASFKRHQQSKDVPYSEGCGGLMWDAWGGTSGIEWAINKLKQIDKK